MSNFIKLVYATLKNEGIDTKDMDTDEAIEKFKELQKKNGGKVGEKEGTPAEQKRLMELGVESKSLDKQINDVLSGENKEHFVTLLNNTPKVFQDLGIPNYPILITAKHTYLAIMESGKYNGKNDHYHNLGVETFKKIPRYLNMPVLVFEQDKENIVAVINMVDKNKNPIIVPIKINGKGNQNFIEIDANIIKSTYGKENYKNYINKNVTKDNLLFFNNKKIRDLNHE